MESQFAKQQRGFFCKQRVCGQSIHNLKSEPFISWSNGAVNREPFLSENLKHKKK